jgi:hypothetical protein
LLTEKKERRITLSLFEQNQRINETKKISGQRCACVPEYTMIDKKAQKDSIEKDMHRDNQR